MAEAADEGFKVTTNCTGCRAHRTLDREALLKLVAVKGSNYSLVNRRSRCRRTGCTGWWRFYYSGGVMRPLWDDAAVVRWIETDWRERHVRWAGSRLEGPIHPIDISPSE